MEHLDARRRQILAAARACFVRDGFHATSMQDILREANLSAGAIYRYFPSKEAIVAAIAKEAIAQVADAFAATLQTDPLPPLDDLLAAPLTAIDRMEAGDQLMTIIIQVWGEAVRNRLLRDEMTGVIGRVIDTIGAIVRRYQVAGAIDPAAEPRRVARVLIGLAHGYIVQRTMLGEVTVPAYHEGIRALTVRPDVAPRRVDKMSAGQDDGGRSGGDPESFRRCGSD